MKVWMKTFFLISLWIISLLANEDVELKMEACVEPANQSDFNFIMIVASYSYERKMMMSVSSECSQLVSCSVSRSRSILKTQTRGGHTATVTLVGPSFIKWTSCLIQRDHKVFAELRDQLSTSSTLSESELRAAQRNAAQRCLIIGSPADVRPL